MESEPKNKRRHYSAAEREQLLAAWSESGESAAVFGARHGVHASNLFRWARTAGGTWPGGRPQRSAKAGFVEDIVPPVIDGEFIGTPGQCFSDSLRTGGGTSLELGVPLERAGDALSAIFAVTEAHTFGAPVALRYVRASQALLAFTHFAPITCTIELPGIDAPRSREAHRLLEIELQKRNIPHTYHWGQVMPLNPEVVRAGFGDARVDAWLTARRGFLSEAGRKLFSNDMLDALGLSS